MNSKWSTSNVSPAWYPACEPRRAWKKQMIIFQATLPVISFSRVSNHLLILKKYLSLWCCFGSWWFLFFPTILSGLSPPTNSFSLQYLPYLAAKISTVYFEVLWKKYHPFVFAMLPTNIIFQWCLQTSFDLSSCLGRKHEHSVSRYPFHITHAFLHLLVAFSCTVEQAYLLL